MLGDLQVSEEALEYGAILCMLGNMEEKNVRSLKIEAVQDRKEEFEFLT